MNRKNRLLWPLLFLLNVLACGTGEPGYIVDPPSPPPDNNDEDAGATSEPGATIDTRPEPGNIVRLMLTDDIGSGASVKGAKDVPAFSFTIAADKNGLMKSLEVTFQSALASRPNCAFGSPCALGHSSERIESAYLYQGDKQLAGPVTIDPATGVALFPKLNVALKQRVGVSLQVRMSYTMLDAEEPFDKIAGSIAVPTDVTVTSDDGTSVGVDLDMSLIYQAGAEPFVVQTVFSRGVLTIADDGHPESRVIVSDSGQWVTFARYAGLAEWEDVEVDLAAIWANSPFGLEASDITQLALAQNGAVKVTAGALDPTSYSVTADASAQPIVFKKGVRTPFELWAKVAGKSGHAPALGLAKNITGGEWSEDYGGKLNVHARGMISGDTVFVNADAGIGNFMLIRNASVAMEQRPVATPTLRDGEMEVFAIRLRVEAGPHAAMRQSSASFVKSPGLIFSGFKLRRGGEDLDPALYQVLVVDKSTGEVLDRIAEDIKEGTIYMTFLQGDQLLSGKWTDYSLYSVVDGASPGRTITLSAARTRPPLLMQPFTGHITNATSPILSLASEGIAPDLTVSGKMPLRNSGNFFIFSDLPNGLHTETVINGLSANDDWWNDVYVTDLSPPNGLTLSY